MASPKSVKAPSAVAPAAPDKPTEADKADPGAVAEMKAQQRETQTGKYGTKQVKPFKPAESTEEKKKVWIEIEMVGEDDKPIPGEPYRITMPDESVCEGTLDEKGFARVEGMDPGSCKVTFPKLDKGAWEKI